MIQNVDGKDLRALLKTFHHPNELWKHVLEHLESLEDQAALTCEWSICHFSATSLKVIKTHVSTHIATPEPPSRHPSQVENIPLSMTPYPFPNPTRGNHLTTKPASHVPKSEH